MVLVKETEAGDCPHGEEEHGGRCTQEEDVLLPHRSRSPEQPLLCKGDNPMWSERPAVISLYSE